MEHVINRDVPYARAARVARKGREPYYFQLNPTQLNFIDERIKAVIDIVIKINTD